MRLFNIALLATGLVVDYVAGFHNNERALTVDDLPQCGLDCLLQTVPAAGCSLWDTECQCASKELTYSTAACILMNCTMADSLGTAKVQAYLYNLPHESKTDLVFASLTIVYTMVCLFVALRFANRLLTKHVRADHWCILAALLLATATYTSAYQMTRYNFGKHLWDLEPGQLQMALRYFYACWNLYVITLGLVKISLVVFYLQVFEHRRFTPIQSFWDRNVKGKCLDVGAIGFAKSALAITEDLIILIMPMPSLWGLQMKRWRKIAVAFMFAVGACGGCITTIIRLRSLAGFKISLDPTWDYTNVVIWTGAELAAGIVCASLPAVRQLLMMILPSRFQKCLTNRSRSRSIPGRDQGGTPISQRHRKGRSIFPVPTASELGKSTFGVTTDISTSSWTKSQAETVGDIERGYPQGGPTKNSVWNPLRTLFPKQSQSFQTSFWSSVDRAGSPPSRNKPTRRPNVTGFQATNPRKEGAETTGKASVDEQIELLRVPSGAYQTSEQYDNENGDVTALLRIGALPDEELRRFDSPWNRDLR